ncbi:MAG: hypothetical protein WCZ89_03780 [Phycisphaerae bacterium]
MKTTFRFLILFSLVIILGSANAGINWHNQVGKWAEPNKWSGNIVPDGQDEVLIRNEGSKCILDSDAGDWDIAQRLRVYGNALLAIEDGASLLGVSWMRVGTNEGPGNVTQTGGQVRLKGGKDGAKLTIGYESGSQGSQYTIKGGTITYLNSDAYLIVGYRGGEGKFTVVGTSPEIKMKRLYVGGDLIEKAGTGIMEFQVDSKGVSPVQITNSIHIDREGNNSQADLIINSIAAPPKTNIVLIENTGSGYVDGRFDTLVDSNGSKPAAEGSEVILKHDETEYKYILTYRHNAGQDGYSNDIALIYEQELAKN